MDLQPIIIVIFSFIVTFFIIKIMFNVWLVLWRKTFIYSNNNNDYWDDTGDGSGVNYVQMSDGSVRID